MSNLPHQVALVSETAAVTFSDISTVAAALQKQATRDFGPVWGVQATVDGFDSLESVPVDYWPVIIKDDIDQPGAAGYHTDNNGQPFALVQADQSWALTASHETLEMLADPFGSRTLAGPPPPNAPRNVADFSRVVYLVEVCDPCEDDQFSYSVNGQKLSDFITPHYYDPATAAGTKYSFGGNIKGPHEVLENGYVSFGNPVTNDWYQIAVANGKTALRNLGKIQTNGKTLRETIDLKVRELRINERYRIKKRAAGAAVHASQAIHESSEARAKALREYIGRF
jgi:hypothetical protein